MVYLGSVLFFMFLCFITLESSISDPKTILYFSHLSGTCFHVLRLCLHDNFAFVKREKKEKKRKKERKKRKKKRKRRRRRRRGEIAQSIIDPHKDITAPHPHRVYNAVRPVKASLGMLVMALDESHLPWKG